MSTVQTISALATPFTPPSSCLANIYTINYVDYIVTAGGGFIEKGWTSDCYPPGAPSVTKVFGNTDSVLTQYYASYIQTACFGGYSSRSGLVEDGTTMIFCCPTGIEWNDRPCERYQPSLLIPVTIAVGSSTFTSNVASLHWPPVTVMYRNNIPPSFGIAAATFGNVITPLGGGSSAITTALVASTTAQITGSQTTVAPVTVTVTDTSNTSTNSSPRTPSSGLSTGDKVGIGVGVAIGVLLLIALAGFVTWRRRNKRRRTAQHEVQHEEVANQSTEKYNQTDSKPEMDTDRTVHEADGQREPLEADNTVAKAELDSGWSGWEAPAVDVSERPNHEDKKTPT